MKKIIFSFTFIVYVSVTSFAQFTEIDSVVNALTGVWKWETYEGGFAGLPPTAVTDNYHIIVSQDASMLYIAVIHLNSYLDSSLQFSQNVSIKIDTQNTWMRYSFSPGLLQLF